VVERFPGRGPAHRPLPRGSSAALASMASWRPGRSVDGAHLSAHFVKLRLVLWSPCGSSTSWPLAEISALLTPLVCLFRGRRSVRRFPAGNGVEGKCWLKILLVRNHHNGVTGAS